MGQFRRAVVADDGMALATVMGISAVLFILASMLVAVSTQGQVNAANQLQRTKALHAADAGISAYCYILSRNAYAAQSQPTTSGTTTDGSWSVTATPPGAGSAVTVITARGTVPAANGTGSVSRTVKATVRPGAFSDYMFLSNELFRLGAGGLVKGNVRSNSYVTNDGEITGYTYAASYINGSGVFGHTPIPNYGTQSFAVVDYGTMKTLAQKTTGSYFGDSGTFAISGTTKAHYVGYQVDLNGPGGTVTKIKSVSTTTGVLNLDVSTAQPLVIPEDGVVYFDDSIWLRGNYSKKLTIVSSKTSQGNDSDSVWGREEPGMGSSYRDSPYSTIYSKAGTNTAMSNATADASCPNAVNSAVFIWGNLQPTDSSNPDQVLGIVTPGDISITSEYPNSVTPDSLYVQAAMLSTAGSIHADWGPKPPSLYAGMSKSYLRILGAEAYFDAGYVRTTDYYGSITGFISRDYWYDPNLDVTTPPNFPPLGDGTLKVKSWVEH
jgi:hypothetical protein